MSLFKKIGKAIGKVAKVALPSLIPGIGPLAGSLIGAAGSSLLGSKGSKKAAGIQSGSYDAAAQGLGNALTTVGGYQSPYMQAGTTGLNALTALNSGDYSGFNTSPDYLYARGEALRGVEQGAAARGGLYSGNAGRELASVASGLASQNLGNYRNALMGQIGIGQGATNALTSATLGTAQNIGQLGIGAGDARASGVAGSTNALLGGIDQASTALGDYFGTKLGKKKKPIDASYSSKNVLTGRPNYNSLVG